MNPNHPMKRIANLYHDIALRMIMSGAAYGAERNIYKPPTIDDMELSTPQCLLLGLLHSLVSGDVKSCVLLADICRRVHMLRSRHFRVWLLEDFEFPRNHIEDATTLLVKLVADNVLQLPAYMLAIMTSLATKYGVHLKTLEGGRCYLANQLENAVVNNNPRDIFELQSEGADVCGSTQSGDSLLHLAARTGCIASIAALSFLNADLEVMNCSNVTPLEEAVRSDCASSVEALLRSGAKDDKRLHGGDTYLHIAAAEGLNNALEALLNGEMGVDEKNHIGDTPLVKAFSAGNVRGVELLIERGADCSDLPEIRLEDGDSIVHSAARSGNVEMLKLLKEKKIPVDPNGFIQKKNKKKKNPNGPTPMHVARNAHVVKMLLSMGAAVDLQDDTGSTRLMIAARNGEADIIDFLLLHKADCNKKDKDGRTALHYAVEGGYLGMVTTLLVAGALLDIQDNKGNTPAFVAAVNNNTAILKLLVENGADLSLRYRTGEGILHREASNGHIEVVIALLDAGAEVDMKDSIDSRTALHYAAWRGHTAVVAVLLDCGANIEAKDGYRCSPLMEASRWGRLEVVQLLIDRGACFNDRSNSGRTALGYANNYNHTAVADYLRSMGGLP